MYMFEENLQNSVSSRPQTTTSLLLFPLLYFQGQPCPARFTAPTRGWPGPWSWKDLTSLLVDSCVCAGLLLSTQDCNSYPTAQVEGAPRKADRRVGP